jgi:hypothetical protein
MKALTSVQLIGIIEQIVDDHPDVEKVIKQFGQNSVSCFVNWKYLSIHRKSKLIFQRLI